MITYQQETLFDVVDEVDSLLQLHYEELTLNRDKIKLDPIWPKYAEAERAGSFVLFTVRDDKKLVGYSAFFVNPHMHYGSLTLAVNDVIFIHPDYRSGRIGLKLIRLCEQYFIGIKQPDREVKIAWHAKLSTALHKILLLLKYKPEEIILGKIL